MNLGVQVRWWWRAFQQLAVESLVVSLAMVVLDVLVNYQPQVALTQQDDSVETFLLDEGHPRLRIENRKSRGLNDLQRFETEKNAGASRS